MSQSDTSAHSAEPEIASRETLEKYDRESVVRDGLPRGVMTFVTVLCVLLALFHLYTSFSGPLVDVVQRSIHLYVLLGLTFILYPLAKTSARDRVPWPDVLFAAAAFAIGCYMVFSADRIIMSAGRITTLDMWIGLAALLLVVDAGRRVTG